MCLDPIPSILSSDLVENNNVGRCTTCVPLRATSESTLAQRDKGIFTRVPKLCIVGVRGGIGTTDKDTASDRVSKWVLS